MAHFFELESISTPILERERLSQLFGGGFVGDLHSPELDPKGSTGSGMASREEEAGQEGRDSPAGQ